MQHWIAEIVVRQFKQGITPEKVALTLAIGLTLGIFPVLGTTTVLCALAAVKLRLNQPIMQLVNYVVYPLQLLAIIPFYRAGDTLLGRPHFPLSASLLIQRFQQSPTAFLTDFGGTVARGVLVWCLLAPPLVAFVYFVSRPVLRAFAVRARVASSSP